MLKITIITSGTLPVPSVNGGAVETLIQTFINNNERTNEFEICLFSIFNANALQLSHSYKNTKFIFINQTSLYYSINRILRHIVNRIKPNYLCNQFIYEVLKYQNILFEASVIIIENSPRFASYIRKITKTTIGLHLHNDYLNRETILTSQKILNDLDFIVAVSQYIKNRVSEISQNKNKVEIVYNGIKLDRFINYSCHSERINFLAQFKINEGEIIILFSGRLQESKGIKILIETFLEISASYNIKLIVIGSSEFKDSKKNKFIKELEKLSSEAVDKIIFTGYIDHSEIHKIYSLADFAVIPSLAPEALSLTSIEAQASGLPVIITDSGGLPETINIKSGIIIKRGPNMKNELKNSMIQLITNTNLRKEMSIEAKKQAIKFNDQFYYDSFSSILRKNIK